MGLVLPLPIGQTHGIFGTVFATCEKEIDILLLINYNERKRLFLFVWIEKQMRTEYRMRDMVFYDDDGNEIPVEELPWSSYAKEPDPCDDSQDWVYQDDGDSTGDSLDTPVLAEKSKSFRRTHAPLPNAEGVWRKACARKRFAGWNCLPGQQQSFNPWSAGMIEKSKAGCAGSAGMKACAATHPWNTLRLTRMALCRTA